eukprot:scaffold330595_cov54-Attheya_sp.AAC.5
MFAVTISYRGHIPVFINTLFRSRETHLNKLYPVTMVRSGSRRSDAACADGTKKAKRRKKAVDPS